MVTTTTRLDQLVGVDAAAIGSLATANGAARADLSNVAVGIAAIFGGATSAFPALKRNGSELDVRLADDSAYADFAARDVNAGRLLKHAVFTVATLPAAAAGLAGARALVTDASSPAFGSNVAGGGASSVPVYCDGTNWKVG